MHATVTEVGVHIDGRSRRIKGEPDLVECSLDSAMREVLETLLKECKFLGSDFELTQLLRRRLLICLL